MEDTLVAQVSDISAINSKPFSRPNLQKRSLLVEMVGPAAAGKTTLIWELHKQSDSICSEIPLTMSGKVLFYTRNTLPWLAIYLQRYRHSRWFSTSEIRSMVYLDAWFQALRRPQAQNEQFIILDHGPLFRLAFLREFGPEISKYQKYELWWNKMLEKWSGILDTIVWLDAPDEVLFERIQTRRQDHVVKGKTAEEVYRFLARYRKVFEEIITRIAVDYHLTILQLDTTNDSPERLARELLTEFDEVANYCDLGRRRTLGGA